MLKTVAAVLRWTADLLDPQPKPVEPTAPVKPTSYTARITSGNGTTVTQWPNVYTQAWSNEQ